MVILTPYAIRSPSQGSSSHPGLVFTRSWASMTFRIAHVGEEQV